MNFEFQLNIQQYYESMDNWFGEDFLNERKKFLQGLLSELKLFSNYRHYFERAIHYYKIAERMLNESVLWGFIINNLHPDVQLFNINDPILIVDYDSTGCTYTNARTMIKPLYEAGHGSRGFLPLLKPGDQVHYGCPMGLSVFTIFINPKFSMNLNFSDIDLTDIDYEIEKWGIEIIERFLIKK